ncbi:hypothetical protein EYE40_03865 [Glaciihabitans arcticus]|uniref:Uncharacterized protein n=1 Tax=Glaciihabitans arcticus TaxID=2668039 RepID=A0A4Q9GVD8_9MICO|nr:hypothetical protein [Glaciihabitans arcticus]TBN56603.1 hypothetical protein EYE40_03865 [Glaciihabitans arcticus]
MTAWIWIVASAALIALLGYTAFRAVRGVIRILLDLSDLATTTAKLDNVQPTRELERPATVVLAGRKVISERVQANRDRTRELRHTRRTARLDRARRLTRAGAADLPTIPVRRR